MIEDEPDLDLDPREEVCPRCRLVFWSGLGDCPTPYHD